MRDKMMRVSDTIDATTSLDLDSDILIVDDDPALVQVMARILTDIGKVRFATNGNDALRLARESTPDLILLDAEMPGMSGFKLFESMSTEVDLADVPVIFVTSHNEASFEISALEMGAVDFIAKPFRSSLVRARVMTQLRVRRMSERLSRISSTDGGTGIADRCRFEDLLELEWRRSRRGGDPMSLLLVDIDQFDLYKDHYGHSSAELCLKRVGDALAGICRRPADFLARGGGEEFMVLLPQTCRSGAEHMARRILDAVEALGLPHRASLQRRNVTVSVGIGCYDEVSSCWAKPGPEHRGGSEEHLSCAAGDLLLAAGQALRSTKTGRPAQTQFCDVGSVDARASA
jgi:diguanylate cyclase (GGDEF)-like protein